MPPAARIVLLGDKDQLAAVESGAVFSELSADPTLSTACVQRLSAVTGIPAARIACRRADQADARCATASSGSARTSASRSDSGIGRLAAHVNAGEADAALDLAALAGRPGVAWIEDATPKPDAASIAAA